MRDYGKLSPFFWTRGSGKRLRGDAEAQVIAAYVSTAPTSNLIGLYYLPLTAIAHDTGVPLKRVTSALDRVAAAGFAFYDAEAELVWVPNVAKFEIGEAMKPGDKRRGKVLAEIAKAGTHVFVESFWRVYGESYALGGCPIEGASEGHPRSSGLSDPIRSDPNTGQGASGDAPIPAPVSEVQSSEARGARPEWFDGVLATLATNCEPIADPAAAWLRYRGHRAKKHEPMSVPDAEYWLASVIIVEQQKARADARAKQDAFDAKRSGPALAVPPPSPAERKARADKIEAAFVALAPAVGT